MAATIDREKVWRVFQTVISNQDISPAQFEEMLETFDESELMLLREFLVTARTTAIRALAERGWPMSLQKPN